MNCKYCNREIKNNSGLSMHEKHCKNNPDRVVFIRSPDAGCKKGCIPWNKGLKLGPSKYRIPNDEIFIIDSTFSRTHMKKRVLEYGLIEYKCAICGIGPEWMNNPMPLIIDHINGVRNDNRLHNLRFVCSNCDSQLPTYKSKNKSNG